MDWLYRIWLTGMTIFIVVALLLVVLYVIAGSLGTT